MKNKPAPSQEQPTLLVHSEVVRLIRQHARSRPTIEICGVLIGQDRNRRIEVTATIEGQNADEAGAHVTFTQDTWEHIYAVKDKKFPEQRIVGWYHSHPGFGVFLSEHDTFIHKNFFSSPGQVAWVFDPQSDEEGCFGWVDGEIVRLARIGIIDSRGGERADSGAARHVESSEDAHPEPQASRARPSDDSPPKYTEPPAIKVRSFDENENGPDGISLEQLVTRVFVLLTVLAMGFALSWYFFPKVEIMPVPVDPRTGAILDPRTGQPLTDPRAGDIGGAERPPSMDPQSSHSAPQNNGPMNGQMTDPGRATQPSSSQDGGNKGNNIQQNNVQPK